MMMYDSNKAILEYAVEHGMNLLAVMAIDSTLAYGLAYSSESSVVALVYDTVHKDGRYFKGVRVAERYLNKSRALAAFGKTIENVMLPSGYSEEAKPIGRGSRGSVKFLGKGPMEVSDGKL